MVGSYYLISCPQSSEPISVRLRLRLRVGVRAWVRLRVRVTVTVGVRVQGAVGDLIYHEYTIYMETRHLAIW